LGHFDIVSIINALKLWRTHCGFNSPKKTETANLQIKETFQNSIKGTVLTEDAEPLELKQYAAIFSEKRNQTRQKRYAS